jgi:hypothetical protein
MPIVLVKWGSTGNGAWLKERFRSMDAEANI